MKKLTSVLCVVCLLIPTITMANQPCSQCLAEMLEEGNLSEENLKALIVEIEEINPTDYSSYVCYYIAFLFTRDLFDCLVYKYIPSCEGWALWLLTYYIFCM